MAEKGAQKDRVNEEEVPSVKSVIKDDLVGVSDFKRSKIGSLTGFSAAARVARGVRGQVSESSSRISGMARALLSSENVAALPDGGDAAERFEASMKLHRKTERDLQMIVLNSYRSSWLYIAISVLGTAASAWSVYAYPAGEGGLGLIDIVARLGPLPLAYALMLKHLYTNWIVRRRRLDGFGRFIAQGDWLPKKVMEAANQV